MLAMGLVASAGWLALALVQSTGSAVPSLAAYSVAAGAVMMHQGWPRLVGLLRVSAAGLAWGLGVGAALLALTYGLYPVVRWVEPAIAAEVQGLYRQLDLANPAMALPLVWVVVVGEELLWRGILLEAVATERRWNATRLRQIAMGSAVYALAQAGFGSVLLVAVAFGCGIVWSALRLHTGQLIAPVASHLIWSSFVLWLVPLPAP